MYVSIPDIKKQRVINTRYKKAESEILFYLDYAYETTQVELLWYPDG